MACASLISEYDASPYDMEFLRSTLSRTSLISISRSLIRCVRYSMASSFWPLGYVPNERSCLDGAHKGRAAGRLCGSLRYLAKTFSSFRTVRSCSLMRSGRVSTFRAMAVLEKDELGATTSMIFAIPLSVLSFFGMSYSCDLVLCQLSKKKFKFFFPSQKQNIPSRSGHASSSDTLRSQSIAVADAEPCGNSTRETRRW